MKHVFCTMLAVIGLMIVFTLTGAHSQDSNIEEHPHTLTVNVGNETYSIRVIGRTNCLEQLQHIKEDPRLQYYTAHCLDLVTGEEIQK